MYKATHLSVSPKTASHSNTRKSNYTDIVNIIIRKMYAQSLFNNPRNFITFACYLKLSFVFSRNGSPYISIHCNVF